MLKKFKQNPLHYLCVILFILTPLFAATLFCLKDGKFISDIYIPLGGWSDEITYYKQIEGILSHGMPKGYFGYNQSRALYGPLGVWGIIPLIPYVLWGAVFGWNYLSPIYANIFFSILAFLGIYILLRPSKKNMCMFSLFWILCHFVNRYVLSGVVEASVFMQLLLVIACGEYLLSDRIKTLGKETLVISLCTFLICILTLARPYYAVLFLIPFWKVIKDKTIVGIIMFPILAILMLVLFFVNSHYFCSTYFTNILAFETLKSAGISGIFTLIIQNSTEIARNIWYAIRYHDSVGWYYLILFIQWGVMLVSCIICLCKKKRMPTMYIINLIGNILILLSFMIIYDLTVGARHILAIIIANTLLLIIESHYLWGAFFGTISVLSVILMGGFLDTPYKTEEYSQYMERVQSSFADAIEITDSLSYENVLAMPTADTDANNPEIKVSTYYGLMFAAPSGIGISLDFEDYYDDVANIKAKYILVHPQGKIKETLEAMGMKCIVQNDDFLLYSK